MKTRSFILIVVIVASVTATLSQRQNARPQGIRKVDFKNFNYGTLCGGPHKFLAVTGNKLILRHGHATQGDAANFTDLGSVRYKDLDGDGREEAFVIINGQTSGSSNTYLAAYVFGHQNGRAKQLWTRCEENSTAELDGRTIVFTSPEWLKGDAHCCFRYVLTTNYALRGGKVVPVSTTRKRSNSANDRKNEDIDKMARELADAFAAGKLERMDAEKPYRGPVTVILNDSLDETSHRRSFSSLKLANDWLKRDRPEINFNTAELDHCRAGFCKFKYAEGGLLHNNLYLQELTYTTAKSRHYIKTISILDGD
jgi:hypothetical protein